MDWELAFWRSEMLRRFKTEFLVKISHELRGPLNAQIGALDLIKANLCDSLEEAQDYVEAALIKGHEHLSLVQETIAISQFDSPITALTLQPTTLDLAQVYCLTHIHARDRGLDYSIPDSTLTLKSDPHGLFQSVLGLSLWNIQQLLYGSITLTATDQELVWTLNGKLKPMDTDDLYWRSPARTLEVLQHQLVWDEPTLKLTF